MSRSARAPLAEATGTDAANRVVAAVRTSAVVLTAALALGASALPASSARVVPQGAAGRLAETVVLEVSGKSYRYFQLTAGAPLVFTVEGPAVFEPILRWRFEGEGAPPDVDVEFVLDGESALHQVFRPSAGKASYPERPDWRSGRPVRVPLDVPVGAHTVELRLIAPAYGALDVNPVVRQPDVLPWRLKWRNEWAVAYDTNIFRYSDVDVEDFLDGLDAEDYPPEYVDDLRLEPSVDISFVREEPGRAETEVRLSADFRLATVNGEKSFARLGARYREALHGLGYALAEYYAIPSYHVRYLWDADVEEGSAYRSCDLRKHAARVSVGSDGSLPAPIDLTAELKYDYSGYDQDFVEYDAHAWTFGATAIVRPARGVRVDLGYALRRSDARGYDEAGETKETSDDGDTSYEQDEYTARVRWDVGRATGDLPTVLTLGVKLARRFYQAERVAEDPYHAGREDSYWTFSLKSAHELAHGTGLEVFYEHRRRSSESDYVDTLGTSKDYKADRVGIRLILEGEQFLD